MTRRMLHSHRRTTSPDNDGQAASVRRTMPTMRIAMIASECEPWAKTGGLADVVDALSRALGAPAPAGAGPRGGRLPALVSRTRTTGDLVPLEVRVPVGRPADEASPRYESVTIWSGAADGYRLRLVQHADSFDRDGLYMDAAGDYPDNAARFTLLGRAALEAIRVEARPVDIIHGHDWQAGPALAVVASSLRCRCRCWPRSLRC